MTEDIYDLHHGEYIYERFPQGVYDLEKRTFSYIERGEEINILFHPNEDIQGIIQESKKNYQEFVKNYE